MTWNDFINSSYNSSGFIIANGTTIVTNWAGLVLTKFNGTGHFAVHRDDSIINGGEYRSSSRYEGSND